MTDAAPEILTEAPKKKTNGSPKPELVTEETIMLVCVGRTPLLMDPMDEESIVNDLILGERKPKDKTTPIRDRAAKKIYRDPAGKIALPSVMLFASLRGAGRKIKVGPRATITKYDGETSLPAILTIREMYLVLKHPEVKDFEEAWVPDVRRGQLQSGQTCGIIRPRFDKWGFEVTVDIDYSGLEGLTRAHILDLFRKSGRNTGLGSFRPACGGQFGTYDIANFVVIEQK